ncbi:hypothetical protein BHM03_00031373 [Ensete ventricosum]|uniref:Uncharacterized protein n=1 Tax=Ensete ventricosum TaxID=4639 RepID=A0A445MID9_ENSVE|nr:hypothetical protein BHM03_00031373 [Ensete ventricosum]
MLDPEKQIHERPPAQRLREGEADSTHYQGQLSHPRHRRLGRTLLPLPPPPPTPVAFKDDPVACVARDALLHRPFPHAEQQAQQHRVGGPKGHAAWLQGIGFGSYTTASVEELYTPSIYPTRTSQPSITDVND